MTIGVLAEWTGVSLGRCHVCLRNRALTCFFRAAMAQWRAWNKLLSLEGIQSQSTLCAVAAPSPAVQQPMAMCQGAGFTGLFNRTPNECETTAAVSWSEGWARGTWLGSPLSFPRARNGGPSPARGAKPHPAVPCSLLGQCLAGWGEGSTYLASWGTTAQNTLLCLCCLASAHSLPARGRGVWHPCPQAAINSSGSLWQQPGSYRPS